MKPSAKTVYLDHSIVTYEHFWPATRTLFHKSDRQLVLSVWNLLEIAGATDLPQRARRIAFLEECGPVWIYDHTFVRRQELKRFLWPNVYNAAPPHLDVYATHLSQAWSVYTGPKLTIGTTMTSLVEDISKVSDIPTLKQLAPTALAKLQSITKKTWKAKQAEVFASVMTGVIPDRRPDGRPLTKDEQKKLVAYCWDNRAAFFQACPTFAVDNALCEARIASPTRVPRDSDGPDIAHLVMALPYCNYLVIRDAFARHCADQARKSLPTHQIARVLTDPADALN